MPGAGESPSSPSLASASGSVSAVSWWKLSKACRTESARSVMPSGPLASVSARNSRHLWTTVSDASGFDAKSRVAACAATMASDSGRRPKGVVECVRMILCLIQAKEICSPKRRRLLTAIRGSVIL
ncbi:MAG: hypothetical protein FD148_1154 [Methylocystaceae bacterium]|nr:MAG: hypothetical protein FD148_1154 [Methylocystaceae bacterium]